MAGWSDNGRMSPELEGRCPSPLGNKDRERIAAGGGSADQESSSGDCNISQGGKGSATGTGDFSEAIL